MCFQIAKPGREKPGKEKPGILMSESFPFQTLVKIGLAMIHSVLRIIVYHLKLFIVNTNKVIARIIVNL